MKRKKRSFTLLEVMVAMCITGMLLFTLWETYRSWYASYEKTRLQQELHMKEMFVCQRLKQVFSCVASSQKWGKVFTLPTKEMVCLYRGGVDPEKDMNQGVRSMLYVDDAKQLLCLASWGGQKERVEVLQDGVMALEMTYFDRQTAIWHSHWPEDREYMPLWIRLRVKTKKRERSYTFTVSHMEEPILYVDKGRK